MKKKFFAVAMATIMATPTVLPVTANAATLSGAWWTAWTEGYELKDKLEFDIDVKGGDAVWNSFATVFVNKKTSGTQAPADEAGEGYKEYAVVRGDNWGWGGGDNKTVDGTDITYEGGIADLGDADFIDTMKDCKVNLVITKNGNDVTMVSDITGANGKTVKRTVKFSVDMSAGSYVFFTPDSATIEVTPVTVSTPEDPSEPSTPEDPSEPSTPEDPSEPSTPEKPSETTTILSGAWWTAWTEGYELKDKLEFDIDVKGGDAVWNSFATVFVNKKTSGTQAPADEAGEGYKEYAVVRGDNWGWGGGDNKTVDGTDITYEGGIADLGDADFIDTMKDCKVNLVITKNGNDVTMVSDITGANGKTVKRTVKFSVDMSAGSYVFFTPDSATIEVTPVTVSTPEDPSDPSTPEDPSEPSTDEQETTTGEVNSPDTDFDITSEDAEKIEKEAIVTGLPENVTLRVASIAKNSTNYQAIVKFVGEKLKNKKVAAADLSLEKGGVAYAEQPNGKVKVTLSLFENIKDAKWIQVYRYDNATKTFVEVDKVVEVKDGKFTFETDHFTPYLFASVNGPEEESTTTAQPTTTGKTVTDTSNKPKTGDSAPIVVFAGMAAAGLAVFAVSKKRKNA